MLKVKSFEFNSFSENTYCIYGDDGKCVIVDAGCFTTGEQKELVEFISKNKLTPVLALNTHGHIDHVFGNAFVLDRFQIGLAGHSSDNFLLEEYKNHAMFFGIRLKDETPLPSKLLSEGDRLEVGSSRLSILHVPGHSPGSLAYYSAENSFVVVGDVLFHNSIGRTDLPKGNHETLMSSIKDKLFTLPDNTVVYCGHGPSTTIGEEKKKNPFFK